MKTKYNWLSVNWLNTDAHIAQDLGCSITAVKWQRKYGMGSKTQRTMSCCIQERDRLKHELAKVEAQIELLTKLKNNENNQ